MTQRKPLWEEITREERYFTSFLFHDIRKNPMPFLKLLKAKGLDCEEGVTIVDVGYEVCFFRDMAKAGKLESEDELIKKAGLRKLMKTFQKLTFDLVFWLSDRTLVLTEAKAQQGFKNDQIDMLRYARRVIASSDMVNLRESEILLAGIKSSRYTIKDANVIDTLKPIMTWQQIAAIYPECASIYLRADGIYRN